jgi:excisionase family DNA binding protein
VRSDHVSTVDFDPSTGRHFYFCPEAGRVEVEDAEIATLCLDPEWLVDWLQAEIPIVPRRRALAVSPAEAARLAGIGRTTIYAAISSGELSSLKLGKRRLIVVTSLRAWLQAHQVTP